MSGLEGSIDSKFKIIGLCGRTKHDLWFQVHVVVRGLIGIVCSRGVKLKLVTKVKTPGVKVNTWELKG